MSYSIAVTIWKRIVYGNWDTVKFKTQIELSEYQLRILKREYPNLSYIGYSPRNQGYDYITLGGEEFEFSRQGCYRY